jgi:hypothetical protein
MKPKKDVFSERQLIESFLSALREVPDTSAHLDDSRFGQMSRNRRVDAIVAAQIADRPVLFVVEVKRSAYPRDVREAVWQLRDHLAHGTSAVSRQEMVPIVVAEALSPGAKNLLREERVGYYDTGGSLFVPGRGIYVYIDKPMPRRQARSLGSIFTGRRAHVLHAVLARHPSWFGVTDLALQTQVSPATASQTLAELDRFDWTDIRGQGPKKERRLTNPRALLDAWTKHLLSIRPPALRRYFVPIGGVDALIRRLSAECERRRVEYAITGETAAQTYAPYLSSLSQVRCRMLAGRDAEDALGALDARAVNEGANLGIIESKFPGDFIFRERINDIWFASPLQAYLDLLQGDGRAREMAEHLRRERLDF